MKLKNLLIASAITAGAFISEAAPVKITMNTVSPIMSLTAKDSDVPVNAGTPKNRVYTFNVDPGQYKLTAYDSDSATVNGTILLNVLDSDAEQEFSILTVTAYVTNTNGDGTVWSVDKNDYVIDAKVYTREGSIQAISVGNSTVAGRNTFLALTGNSYNVAFIPNDSHQAEGYATLYKGGTLTANANVYGAIPAAGEFSVSLPKDAELAVGIKFTHFTDFTIVEPKSVDISGANKVVKYNLANGQVYNYRTWKSEGLTHAGYFTMSTTAEKCPKLAFTDDDYKTYSPKTVNHDVKSNNGYETGDILLNINERGHLCLNPGDTFNLHAMRMWELTDNTVNNYFIEPDFHYTVISPDGKPSGDVIEISANPGSAWANLKAVGKGTAIVMVSYDGINLNYYSGAEKKEYLGGEYWGAIWPENTGVFVVSVGEPASSANPNMTVNEDYNTNALKIAGKYVDAEHDVFYYINTDEGFYYTFTPEGIDNVTVAYPAFNDESVTYGGFGSEGIVKNNDGSYTLLLKYGRQIVKLTDVSGKSVYQVVRAKPCYREIINATREGSQIFQPGDQIKIQYSGLFHPANKIAGIYNMSAYVTYNETPNGSSLILGSGQYTFASAASAQAVTVDIPDDYDVSAAPEIVMDKGVIQVNGFGDPIGNHRNTSPVAGRSPNFTAVAHKTYFGAIPDVRITLTERQEFAIALNPNAGGAEISVIFNGKKTLLPDDEGIYHGTYGTYSITAKKEGYRCYRNDFVIGDDAEGLQTFNIEMIPGEGLWDGKSMSMPETDDEGVYAISTPDELAFLANYVNSNKVSGLRAKLVADIDLGDYDWTPIGNSTSYPFSCNFDGQSHTVNGLYINKASANYQGLFGCLKGAGADNVASVTDLRVNGSVSGKQYVGGVVGYMQQYSIIERCANYADLVATSYAGGITGYLSAATASVSDCYNVGDISKSTYAGGIAGASNKDASVKNVFSIGKLNVTISTGVGACVGGPYDKSNVVNAFAIEEYGVTDGHILVTEAQMASGEVAYRLGSAFGQTIGVDLYPVLGGMEVKYDPEKDIYYNGVSNVAEVTEETAVPEVYYNLQGIASSAPWQGLNIVRMSDGTTKKMYMK